MGIRERIDAIEETERGHVQEALNELLGELQEQADAGDKNAALDICYLEGYLETPAAFLLDLLSG